MLDTEVLYELHCLSEAYWSSLSDARQGKDDWSGTGYYSVSPVRTDRTAESKARLWRRRKGQ